MLADFLAALTFTAGYNSAVATLGAGVLGLGAGVVGTFALLRRQSLISDAVSHAALPGIALGFLLALALFGDGRKITFLIAGAAFTGWLGALCVGWIKTRTRLTEDAAIATVLSVFFGLGVALMSHIQTLATGGQAGLNSFLLGAVATMNANEAQVIATAATLTTIAAFLLLKEFAALAFDAEHAWTIGLPVRRLDLAITGLLLAIVAVGLKTVGLVLIVALIVIPPAAARLWTARLGPMAALSGMIGALSCYLGGALSTAVPHAPTGAVIVLIQGAFFAVSFCLAPERGICAGLWRTHIFRHRIRERQALMMRARGAEVDRRAARALTRRGYLDNAGRLTSAGLAARAATVADWKLWRRYLADYPDRAAATPEWGAQPITHHLPADLVRTLERRVRASEQEVPEGDHGEGPP